jgi:hypothetical protein
VAVKLVAVAELLVETVNLESWQIGPIRIGDVQPI